MLTIPGLRTPNHAMPRLVDIPGTTLRLVVMVAGRRHCVGIDTASGALVRAWSDVELDHRFGAHDVVEITIGGHPDSVPDPAEPEAVVMAGTPRLISRMSHRQVMKLVRPLLHPENTPLLGSNGPAVAFWERSPDHPSVALAAPKGPIAATVESGGLWCHFLWDGRPHVLACTDPRLSASIGRAPRDYVLVRDGAVLVIALEPPVEGQCHKVVEAVVPR